MGGSGSGRWGLHTKADTVEDCRVLDLNWLARQGAFTPGYAGEVRWKRGEQEVAAIGYGVLSDPSADGRLILALDYTISRTGERVAVPVLLEATRPHFGGVRWWGRCPLLVNGDPCRRRVAKLYLPPGGKYFGCRRCYGLTSTSCQESHKFDSLNRLMARNLGWEEADVRRAMRALEKRQRR